eukprot:8271814-Pyramimonas_sp.AAC.1
MLGRSAPAQFGAHWEAVGVSAGAPGATLASLGPPGSVSDLLEAPWAVLARSGRTGALSASWG